MAKKPVWVEKEIFRPYSYIMDHVAKKDHKCNTCSTDILSGTLYYEKKIMTPSYYFYSERMCAECFEEYKNHKDS